MSQSGGFGKSKGYVGRGGADCAGGAPLRPGVCGMFPEPGWGGAGGAAWANKFCAVWLPGVKVTCSFTFFLTSSVRQQRILA